MRSPSCYCCLFLLDWGWNIPTICSWRQTKQLLFLSYVSCGWSSCLHACLHKANVGCDDGLHAAPWLALVHSPHPLPTHQELRSRGTDRGETQQWPFQRKQGPLFSFHPPHPCSSTPTNASPPSLLSQGPSALFLLWFFYYGFFMVISP